MRRKNVVNNDVLVNKITIVFDHYYEYPITDLDMVLRDWGNPALMGVIMYVDRIKITDDLGYLCNDDDGDTFLYASIEAAKDGKVWVEEAHAFMSPQFKSTLEGGCVDLDDLNEEFAEEGGWYAFVRENLYQDIFGYRPVTGGENFAIVYDEDVAEMAELDGYDVLPYVNFDKEEGEINFWKILAKGGEDESEEIFDNTDDLDEAYDEDENGNRVYVEPESKSLELLDDDMKELFMNFAEDQDDFDPDYKGTIHYKNGKWMKDEEYEVTCKAEAKKFVEAHREELRDAFTRMAVIGYLSGI